MSTKVIVSGSGDRMVAVSKALEAAGCDVVSVTDLERSGELAAQLGADSIDGYVQLPVEVKASGPTVVERVREFLAAGLLARYAAVTDLLPTVRDGGVVLLVAGNLPDALTGPDDQRARIALLRVLRKAILADRGQALRTVVVDHRRAPDEIARLFVEGPPNRHEMIAEFSALTPDMSFDDWRLQVLSLSTIET